MTEVSGDQLTSMEKQTRSSEITLTAKTDFKETVAELMSQLGGKVASDGTLLLGEDHAYDEDRDLEISFPKEVGRYKTVEILVESSSVFNDNTSTFDVRNKYAYYRMFIFGGDLKDYFKLLISALPVREFSRVLQSDNKLVVYIYDNLESCEAANLLEQTKPLPSGNIGFSQGEWVLVDGNETNHCIVSFGRNTDGCRYWLIYDASKRRVAASHLDLPTDVECVSEMVAALTRGGCNPNDLLVYGSPNASEVTKRKIKSLFPNATFDLSDDAFIFDARTGERGYPSEDVFTEVVENESELDCEVEKLEIRLKFQIGHVLRYCSPGL